MNPANENKPKADDPVADGAPCPICGKPSVAAYRPFCSKRCADVDLQRWFSGRYAIPAVEDDEDRDEGDRDV
ncbi:DNA gyrase inhibitor YacG [Microvirga pudoricolor]|uniref:DNA gyrase inhibitor YacG n=1 Tax=Microvirga pudoricolor TaxID=2778729 RepID=UPI001951F88B|nr:DNA gyrase inhibitor YacG [Microvirga pudoricolor]MBM6594450.1 DNA gyrase inhibitor YacG [Microvirga pudoricolor]